MYSRLLHEMHVHLQTPNKQSLIHIMPLFHFVRPVICSCPRGISSLRLYRRRIASDCMMAIELLKPLIILVMRQYQLLDSKTYSLMSLT